MSTSLAKHNLKIIAERDPGLAGRLSNVQPSGDLRVESDPHGLPVLKALDQEGCEILLDDPSSAPEALLSGLKEERLWAEDASLLIGFGLGYRAEAIARLMEPDHQLFIVEPSSEVFKLALHHRNLSPLFTQEGVHLNVGTDIQPLRKSLQEHLVRIMAGRLYRFTIDSLKCFFSRTYGQVEDAILKSLLHLRSSFQHNNGNMHLLKNCLLNTRHYAVATDLTALRGRFSRWPAAVVSGGPSLDKNIDRLADLRNRALILCVDTALKPLLDRGIEPHLVVSADPFDINRRKFDDLPPLKKTGFVFETGVYHEIPDCLSGPKFLMSSRNSLSRWLMRSAGFEETTIEATSATHLAFHAAREVGADPIVFLGLDLSFPDGAHHASGAAPTWSPNEAHPFVAIPGVHGVPVRSIPAFQAMIGLLETEIPRTTARCIDATEGGALVRGTEIMSLEAAGKAVTTRNDHDFASEVRAGWQTGRKPGGWFLISMTALLIQVREIFDHRAQLIPLIETARGLILEDGMQDPEFAKVVGEIQRLDQHIADKQLFHDAVIDFQGELCLEQHLRKYRIYRTKEGKESLLLSLDAIRATCESARTVAIQANRWLTEVLDLWPHIGVVAGNTKRVTVFFNRAAESLTGHRASKYIREQKIDDLFPLGEWNRIRRGLRPYDSEETELTRMETLLVRKNGRIVPVELKGVDLVHGGEYRSSILLFRPT